MFNWLKNIIKKLRSQISVRNNYDIRINELSKKAQRLSKKCHSRISISWFHLENPTLDKKELHTYKTYSFKQIFTLRFLKEERIKKENARIESVKQNIRSKLKNIDSFVENEKPSVAQDTLNNILSLTPTIPNDDILVLEINLRKESIKQLSHKLDERERERLRKLEEERIRKEEEERKRKEELARRERERRENELRIKREKEQRLLEEGRRKEAEENRKREEKRKELERLTAHTKHLKSDKEKILEILKKNNITHFYHFTDESNLKSIKEHKGLLSWDYCEKHNIIIPLAGGDESSRDLDRRHGLEDYVRLSFCNDHPMAFNVYKRRGANLVLLRIKIDVALFSDTIFSDINAADSNHNIGNDAIFLENNIDFSATQENYVKKDSPAFKPHQAEILVKTFIPIEYIENINIPTRMKF